MTAKSYHTLQKISAEIREWGHDTIPRQTVERIIMQKVGIDSRTVQKYMHALVYTEVIRFGKHFNELEIVRRAK